jgi:hypothetical protein
MGCWMDCQGSSSGRERELTVLHSVPNFSGAPPPTQPPIQQVSGNISLEVKWSGREADHSPPSSAEDKNGETIS